MWKAHDKGRNKRDAGAAAAGGQRAGGAVGGKADTLLRSSHLCRDLAS